MAQQAAFDAVWERFCSEPLTLGPSEDVREAWHRGRDRYAVWLLRVEHADVCRRVTQIAESLAPIASAVPANQHHITLFVAGFPRRASAHVQARPAGVEQRVAEVLDDDVELELLEEQAKSVAAFRDARRQRTGQAGPTTVCEGSRSPLVLWVGHANAFLTAAFLELHDPSQSLSALRAALAAPFIRRSKPELRFAPYLPHVTIAHFHDGVPTERARALLESQRSSELVPLQVSALELVDFWARTPHAPFRRLHRCVF
jgi:hypothetical protein